MSSSLEDMIKDYVIKYGLWDNATSLSTDVPLASLILDDSMDSPCAGPNESMAAWSIVRNSVERGSIVSLEDVDAAIKRACEIILSAEYEDLLAGQTRSE